jgi:hypothetical protein
MAFQLVFRRYAPFAQFGFGFEGDRRPSASISTNDTARTIGVVPFERGYIGSMSATSSGTHFTGAGEWFRRLAGGHKSDVACEIAKKVVFENSVSFTASTAGANPMVPGAPAIDTYVDFKASWLGTGVRFEGVARGDDFPNAEVFVVDDEGLGCLLFDGRTTGGRQTGPMTRLMGSHESQYLGSFSCAMPLTLDGGFTASKSRCPITTMSDRPPPETAWTASGGAFSGGGASSKW